MYFMGCFPFGSGPSHPEPHCWNKFIENSEFSRERSSLDPPTPRNFLTFLNLIPKFSAIGPKFASVQKFRTLTSSSAYPLLRVWQRAYARSKGARFCCASSALLLLLLCLPFGYGRAQQCLPAPLLRVAYPRLCFGLPTLRVWQAGSAPYPKGRHY